MKEAKVITPTKKDTHKVLGNSVSTAHAAKCGTCACKCACRYSSGSKKAPW